MELDDQQSLFIFNEGACSQILVMIAIIALFKTFASEKWRYVFSIMQLNSRKKKKKTEVFSIKFLEATCEWLFPRFISQVCYQ